MARSPIAVVRQHVAEIVLAVEAIITASAMTQLSGEQHLVAVAVASVGIQIATAVFFLKHEVFTRLSEILDDRLQVYADFFRIAARDTSNDDDSLLVVRAKEAIQQCQSTLAGLAEGRIRDRAEIIFNLLSGEIEAAREQIRAVHVGYTLEHMTAWNLPYMLNYCHKNCEAAKRDVGVERLFVLYKETALDSNGDLRKEIANVIAHQEACGIEVLVAWDSDITDKGNIQNLVVIDKRLAEYDMDPGGFVSPNFPFREAYIHFDSPNVRQWTERYERLKACSLNLAEWLVNNHFQFPDGVNAPDHPSREAH